MKVPSSLSNLGPNSTPRQPRTDALADAIAAVVREAQRIGIPQEVVIAAIWHVWPAGERH